MAAVRVMSNPATWDFKAICFAAWIPVCLKVAYESVLLQNPAEDSFYKEVYLYYNPFVLMSAMVWLWGINVWVFLTLRLPYAQVFELDSSHINHKDIWKIASWMTAAVMTSMTAYLYLYAHGMVFYAASQPILLYLMVPLVMGLPRDVLYKQTRFFFLKTLVRLAFPIQPVLFADFFIGDVITSMAKVLSDLERAVCRMYHGQVWIEREGFLAAIVPHKFPALVDQVATVASMDANDTCGGHSIYVPVVLVFPFFCRLLQCLRQYKDTKDKTTLLNALKYTTTFPVIFLSALKYHVQSPFWYSTLRPVWVLFAIVNSGYSYWWDITKDWDLGWMSGPWKPRKQRLRANLLYSRPWIYYWSIISNMVLRGAWTYKLSAELRKNYKIVFLFSFLEMMRRFQWIFFRVEIAVLKISNSSTPSSLTQVLPVLLGCSAGALAYYLWNS